MTEGVRRATQGERASEGGVDDLDGPDGSDAGPVALVTEPAFAADARGQIERAVAGGEGDRSVLAVLYRHDVGTWTTTLRANDERLDSAAVVAVGPVTETGADCAAVRTVADPTDLTGVGIAVGEWLRARDDDERPVVCLDSLSTLLQYADPERAFRFCHGLTAQVRSTGAAAFVSVDPGAHDEATLGTFRTLFDTVIAGDRPTAGAGAQGGGLARPDERAVVTDGGDPAASGGPASGPE